MKKTNLIYFTLAALMLAAPAEGQILKETETKAIKTAALAGELAGGGFYCKVDEDALNDFITLAYARIANQAVVAQLEFSNNYSAWSARAPKGGCDVFSAGFEKKFEEIYEP